MKKLLMILLFLALGLPLMAQKKLSKDDRSKLTPEQRMVYDNSRRRKVNKVKQETVQNKVKRAKKEDKKSRRIKSPKRVKLKPKK